MPLVHELSTRPYTPADTAGLAALLNSLEEHVGAPLSTDPEHLARYLSQALTDPERDATIWTGPGGRIIATGIVTAPPPGGTRILLYGGVHPNWRGRGIGREVMRGQIARATELHAQTAPPGTAWIANSTVPVQDESAIRLYRRFGMTARRYWVTMRRSTSDVQVTPIPDGLRMERYRLDLAPAMYAADIESFSSQYASQVYAYERWLVRMVPPELFLPELSVLIFDGAELAGYLISHRGTEPGVVSLRRLAVRPAWQGRGLMTAMLTMALSAAAGAGWHSAVLQADTENPWGATGRYERIGFTTVSRTVTHELAIPGQQPASDREGAELT